MVSAYTVLIFGARLYASDMDQRIESSARESYVFKTYLKDDSIQVQSMNGDVTLTGTVSEETNKNLAQQTVVSLPGVKSVDNRLEVKGVAADTSSDAWLAAKVKSTLLFHRNVYVSNTEVSAKGATITLRGQASNQAQKDLSTQYAKDVDGVDQVINEMTLPAAAQNLDVKTVEAAMVGIRESIDDASISAMTKMTMLYHRSTSALNTTVDTKDGVVTLGGKGKNEAEKVLASKLFSGIRGVKRVDNNMLVEAARANQ